MSMKIIENVIIATIVIDYFKFETNIEKTILSTENLNADNYEFDLI